MGIRVALPVPSSPRVMVTLASRCRSTQWALSRGGVFLSLQKCPGDKHSSSVQGVHIVPCASQPQKLLFGKSETGRPSNMDILEKENYGL